MSRWRLVADVGGTNLRIGCTDADGRLAHAKSMPLAACSGVAAELTSFAGAHDADALEDIVIAAAGSVDGGRVTLTNRAISIDATELSACFGRRPVIVMNDLQAVALALPVLGDSETPTVIDSAEALSGPRLVVNVGTGFGAALLVGADGDWTAVACEPGHMTFPDGPSPRAWRFAAPATVESYLSGLTLADDDACLRAWGRRRPSPDTVTFGPNDDQAFVTAFSALLGHVCGNLVLACGAWGGVHLVGGVAERWRSGGDIGAFTEAFQQKGPMTERMRRVPVREIRAPNASLIGLAQVRR